MKTRIFIFLVLGCASRLFAQSEQIDTSKVNLDVLKAPSSPAFNLLGLSPSDIDRPTDVNAFALSLQNSTKNFTSLPNSYAVELAPVYLFQKKLVTLDQFKATDFKHVFWQSFTFSMGYTHMGPEGKEDVDSLRQSKVGLGFKFSIIRPKFSEQTQSVYDNLVIQQKIMLQNYLSAEGKHELAKEVKLVQDSLRKLTTIFPPGDERIAIERPRLIARLANLNAKINEDANVELEGTEAFQAAKKIAADFKIERVGPFLDFAAGLTLDFPDDRFNNSSVTKGGAWLTGGFESGNHGITAMGIARYLFQPDKILADDNNIVQTKDVSTFDAGGKLLFNGFSGRFALSIEVIYRSILTSSTIGPSWRLVFNTEYDIGKNKKLTFAFGRNFDGAISKGGNLIAALNFISSFGSAKKISSN
ncbi:hypothetical protein [Pedobacter steynii]